MAHSQPNLLASSARPPRPSTGGFKREAKPDWSISAVTLVPASSAESRYAIGGGAGGGDTRGWEERRARIGRRGEEPGCSASPGSAAAASAASARRVGRRRRVLTGAARPERRPLPAGRVRRTEPRDGFPRCARAALVFHQRILGAGLGHGWGGPRGLHSVPGIGWGSRSPHAGPEPARRGQQSDPSPRLCRRAPAARCETPKKARHRNPNPLGPGHGSGIASHSLSPGLLFPEPLSHISSLEPLQVLGQAGSV